MACEGAGDRATRSEACELDRTIVPHCSVVEGLDERETELFGNTIRLIVFFSVLGVLCNICITRAPAARFGPARIEVMTSSADDDVFDTSNSPPHGVIEASASSSACILAIAI